jgi:hypothetical protein
MIRINSAAEAFAAGAAGALIFLIVFWILNQIGITPDQPFPAFWYKQLVWGGIWGFAFLIPLLRGQWWLRGLIVGAVASLAAIFVFGPGIAILSPKTIVMIFVLNCVAWGMPAAYLNDEVLRND